MKTAYRRAVTLIELVITFVLISIVSTLAVTSLSSSGDYGIGLTARSEILGVLTAVENYRVSTGELPDRPEEISKLYGTPLALVSGPVDADVFVSVDLDPANNTVKVAKPDTNGNCWMVFRDFRPSVGAPSVVYSLRNNAPSCDAANAETTVSGDGTGLDFTTPKVVA